MIDYGDLLTVRELEDDVAFLHLRQRLAEQP
jgi:hypothetical protein